MAGHKRRTTSSKKKKKNRQTPPTAGAAAATSQTPPDLNQILSQADVAMDSSNVEVALQLYNYAATLIRQKVQQQQQQQQQQTTDLLEDKLMLSKILSKMGEIKVSLGDQNASSLDFSEAIQLLSSSSYDDDVNGRDVIQKAQWKEARANLYLYLGQLCCGKDALQNFSNAITDLKECLNLLQNIPSNTEQQQKELIETQRQLCGAYCSVAELYLTDLCYEENAESECENVLKLALQLDDPKSTPDSVQAMANLRLCQNRNMEAIPYILDSYSRIQVGCEAMADLVGLGRENNEEKDVDRDDNIAKEMNEGALKAANTLPGFEFRCQTAKILLECALYLEQNDTTSNGQGEELSIEKRTEQRIYCIEAAIQTLGSLMAENDEVIETWYLLGCAFQSKSDHDASKHYYENALQMLLKTKEGLQQESNCGIDEDMADSSESTMEDITQKIEEVQKKLAEIPQIESTEMEED